MATRVLTVFGTRPEAIKLAPVILTLSGSADIEHATCVTGQHRQMLDQVLSVFDLQPEFDLEIMRPGQDLSYVTSAVLEGMKGVIDQVKPDWVIVQGDTTTAFSAALAAFYAQVKVAHVEAGLRTGNIYSPWPEEMNRKLVTQLATLHFAPTQRAADNLTNEAVPGDQVMVTGNTVIDALHVIQKRFDTHVELSHQMSDKFSFLDEGRRLILVTGHRRENFDGGLERVCVALRELARIPGVEIVYPVHLNPNVQTTAKTVLGEAPTVHLIEPLDYLPFVYLMQRAHLIITDSGGIQEEAPALGKPVIVTRDTTERPEAVDAGTALLAGTDANHIVSAASKLLNDEAAYEAMAQARNPFGDGRASQRILNAISKGAVQ